MASELKAKQELPEIEEIAHGWGNLLAKLAFPEGVGLDVSLGMMEELAVAASKALMCGVVESMTTTQAEALGAEAACPECGRSCQLQRRSRPVQLRGGTAKLQEPVAHCSTCRRDFFPSASAVED